MKVQVIDSRVPPRKCEIEVFPNHGNVSVKMTDLHSASIGLTLTMSVQEAQAFDGDLQLAIQTAKGHVQIV